MKLKTLVDLKPIGEAKNKNMDDNWPTGHDPADFRRSMWKMSDATFDIKSSVMNSTDNTMKSKYKKLEKAMDEFWKYMDKYGWD